MPEKQRPRYGGVPKTAEAEIAARRQRTDDVAAAAPPPPAPQPKPALLETRLKAIEDRLDGIAGKLDLLVDVLTHGDKPHDPPPSSKRSKART